MKDILTKHILDFGAMPTKEQVRVFLKGVDLLKADRLLNRSYPDSYWIRKAYGMSGQMAAEFATQIREDN